MCGIAGFVDSRKLLSHEILKSMTDSLIHRGPDDAGYYFDNLHHVNIGLGHRRLSILDLTNHGHQPMQHDDVHIVYNGEVYNFQELRKDLINCGYTFISNSDTEVILKLYHKEGINFLKKINGMYAIAIYDKRNDKFFLVRDRAGVKPLYWMLKDNTLLFSSELKALHSSGVLSKEIDEHALLNFFQYGYISSPKSIFKEVQKLTPGSYLEFDLKNYQYSITEYWSLWDFYNKPKVNISYGDALINAENILKDACALRMVSDVPVGLFLSGGYDSSLITALVQAGSSDKINTFSLGFDEDEFNEAHHAKKIAEYLGTNHHELICRPIDAINLIEKIPLFWDEPFGDSSAIPTMLVSKFARDKVKVSLSADGGDEIFGGYNKYRQLIKIHTILNNPFYFKILKLIFKALRPISGFLNKWFPKIERRIKKISIILESKDPIDHLSILGSIFLPEELKSLVANNPTIFEKYFDRYKKFNADVDEMNQVLAVDYLTYQADDILCKVDRATMACSLEGREPLLDYRLIEYIATLPFSFKATATKSKILLKDITHKYIPKDLMERPKMGFGIPLAIWLKEDLSELLEFHLSKEQIDKFSLLNYSHVQDLKNRYFDGESELSDKLWLILVFQMWCQKWL